MLARAPSKRRWASPRWSRCWCCVWLVSRRCLCKFAALMPHVKLLGWPRVVMSARPSPPPAVLPPVELLCRCVGTASSLWRLSLPGRICCPPWLSRLLGYQRWSRHGERGSATVVAATMVVVLLSVTGGSAYLGSAVVARHRAQAAADLGALAAAARLPAGLETACAQATAVGREMRVDGIHCAVEDLDAVVTVEVRVAVGGWGRARAAARAGPDNTA
jgi:secretion/DNA translocation related TadE-like protein